MLRADVVIRAHDTALKHREVAFNGVRMHVATDILAVAVINGLMAVKQAANPRAVAADGSAALDQGEQSFLATCVGLIDFDGFASPPMTSKLPSHIASRRRCSMNHAVL